MTVFTGMGRSWGGGGGGEPNIEGIKVAKFNA